MTKKNVRNYSFEISYNIFYDGKLLNNEINNIFNSFNISDEDKSFIKKECTGVIEKIETIDNIINIYSKVPTNKLKKDILVVLRLGTYEIMYMDKVPAYAIVNEYVNIIKNTKYKSLSGYVNAVLKNIFKNEKVCTDSNIEKFYYFRIFNDKEKFVLDELNNKGIKFSLYDGALHFNYSKIYTIEKYGLLLDLESFKKGYILIIDASSAFLADVLYDQIDSNFVHKSCLNMLDTCASPGGKTFSLYDIFNYLSKYDSKTKFDNCIFEARDINDFKINRIKENMKRLCADDINTKIHDATIINDEDIEKYDVVICDVPCSGLGVISKKPDIVINFNRDKLLSLVNIQRRILEVSKKYVKVGGLLSYSTCTETKEENEDNIKFFLKNNNDYKLLFEKKIIHGDENKSDGFYISIMKRL